MLDQSRLEATNTPVNPKRPRRKPLGPTFWKLFTAFLFFGPAVAVFLLGYLIYGTVASEDKPETLLIQVPAEEAAPGPHLVTAEVAVPAAETGPGPAPNLFSLGLNLLTGGGLGQNLSGPAAIKVAKADQFFQDENGVWRNTGAGESPPVQSEHIYQDESGVWRNLSLGAGPNSASPAPVDANPIASIMSGLVSQGGETSGNPLDMLGGLLGGGVGNDGGDLGGLMGALMGGGGQGGGDLPGLIGLRPLMAPPGAGSANTPSGVAEIAPLNVTRVRPQSFDSRPDQLQASQITSNSTGFGLEGYERFDPAKAGEIKSDWEFFDDPR